MRNVSRLWTRDRCRLWNGDSGRAQDIARRRDQAVSIEVVHRKPARSGKSAAKDGIPLDVPYRDLTPEQKHWVIEGGTGWKSWNKSWPGVWYGGKRFFAWLESKAYKMHIRVLLSRYRSYTPCPACGGARLKPDALLWRVGGAEEANAALASDGKYARYKPINTQWSGGQLLALPGLSIHDLMLLPIERVKMFFDRVQLPAPLDQASEMLLDELRG